ncbi:MAG: hypothetical protein V2A54_15360 [Bacteroidota bacterium]
MKKILLLTFTLLAAIAMQAQQLKPTQINVFKNGTYFIAKEGNVNCTNGKAVITVPAAPLLGTYWLNTMKDAKIQQVTVKPDTLKTKRRARSINDILQANTGKKVKITYVQSDKSMKEFSGKLLDYYRETGVVKVQNNDGKIIFLNNSTIAEVMIDDNSVGEFIEKDSLATLATIQFAKNADNIPLRVMYMHGGIQWVPSYNIKVINDKELQLEMKALVENYSESVEDADLTLTMGNPQFFYGMQLDPIATNYLSSISSLYTATAPGGRNTNLMTNSYAAQSYSGAVDFGAVASEDRSIVNFENYTTEGEKSNDLYMYKIGKVTLFKNSKTWFQVFAANIPYKDVYEVNVFDVVNYCTNRYIGNDPEQRFDVYHSYKITNTTTTPLTTGPIFVLNENLQPLAQDRLKYTPVQAEAMVQLSKAGDVYVRNTEEEISKIDAYKRVGKRVYNKATIKGTIQIENMQDKKINLNVTKNLNALVLDANEGGKFKKSGKYYNQNPYSEIKWEIPLNGGEKKTITYTYDVLY